MFEGYLSFAGDEVINVARTKAYVAAGYAPSGAQIEVCEDCDLLPEMLGDDAPYASPMLDDAPWVETGNPDSWDFAGIIPLEITGASGSTRTVATTELSTDGGVASRVRYAGRTIAVTALLVGKTGCSVESGLSWLSTVLGGTSCSGPRLQGAAGACSGDEACMFICCPGSLDETPVEGEYVVEDVETTDPGWRTVSGLWEAIIFNPPTDGGRFTPVELPVGVVTNLVTNPSFEVDASGWQVAQGSLLRVDDKWGSRVGFWSGLVTAGATLTEAVAASAVVDGTKVTLSASGIGTAANPTVEAVTAGPVVVNGSSVALDGSGLKVPGPGQNLTFGPTQTFPVTAGQVVDWVATIGARDANIGVQTTLQFLNAAGAVAASVNGTLVEIRAGSYSNSRVSTNAPAITPVAVATNLATNPALEGGALTGWNAVSGTAYPVTLDTAAPISGTRSALTVRASTLDATVSALALSATTPAYAPAVAGSSITFSVDVKTELAGRRVRAFIQYFDGVTTSSGPTLTLVDSTVAGAVNRIAVTGTVPVGMNSARLRVIVDLTAGTATLGEKVWYDRAKLSTSTDPTYFDGTTPTAAPYSYRWTGAANASTSEQLSATMTVKVVTTVVRPDADGGGGPAAGTGVYVDAAAMYIGLKAAGRGFFDGDTRDSSLVRYDWTGQPGLSTSTLTPIGSQPELDAPVQECAEESTFLWNVSTVSGEVRLVPAAKSAETGGFVWYGTPVTVHGLDPVRVVADLAWGDWIPVLLVDTAPGAAPFIVQPSIRHTRYTTPEECAENLMRSYLDVTTTSGPTVVEKIVFNCGEYALKVEWTMFVGNPFVYGPEKVLAKRVWTADGQPSTVGQKVGFLATGVASGNYGEVRASETACADKGSGQIHAFVAQLSDPRCPGYITPPAVPSITETCLVAPGRYDRTVISVPASYAPSNDEGTLNVVLANDAKVKRGIRVRIYPDPTGDGYVGIENCDYCEEFTVTYLPKNAVMTINGVTRQVTTRVAGANQDISTAASVRGPNGGPFDFPALLCNMGYLVVVDNPRFPDIGIPENPPDPPDSDGELWVDVSMRTATG